MWVLDLKSLDYQQLLSLNESEAVEHVLVHTGQNYDYELNEVFFKDFNLKKPDFFLNAATGTAIETIGIF